MRDARASDSARDRSSAARLADGAVWDCPFPREADEAAVDHASVTLRVEVDADGKVRSARATSAASQGFAREASRCALAKRWAPAHDRSGQSIASAALVNVHFDR